MKSIKGILGGIRQADQLFNLIENNDRIMIGVSGGKDSMVLCYALNLYKKFSCSNFEIVPTILDLGFDGFDAKPISDYLSSIGLKLNVVDAKDVYQILKIQKKEEKHLPCSICSRMKKAAINKAAKALNCNKVAFAHHADDAIETLFMNEIFGGRIATFQPKMYLERANIMFIRPLILIRENEIISCQKEENIPSFSSHCPNDGFTMRKEMKDMMNDIYKKYPSSKNNFLTMLYNYKKETLFKDEIYYKIEKRNLSLKPVISNKDQILELSLRNKMNCLSFSLDDDRFIVFKRNKPIGIISFKWVKKDEIIINLIKLLKEDYINDKKAILSYLENYFKRTITPIKIFIKKNDDKLFYKENGYKTYNKSYLLKQIIK